jgi:hypothetical protein
MNCAQIDAKIPIKDFIEFSRKGEELKATQIKDKETSVVSRPGLTKDSSS